MNAFWAASLAETVATSRTVGKRTAVLDPANWLSRYREGVPTSSNQGTTEVPFQRWFRFKEAFSPKFVIDTLASLDGPVEHCLDPFGGSGTTALTCRMLGLSSTSIEVNPFLADLIEAKIEPVSSSAFLGDYEDLLRTLEVREEDTVLGPGMPATFAPPGVNGRHVFSTEVFGTVRAIVREIPRMAPAHGRLLKVLLGSTLVSNSNVVVNGKGRRYRRNWQERERTAAQLIQALDAAVDTAIEDISLFSSPKCGEQKVLRGDCRTMLRKVKTADLAIFSPPYPNSFDYTDVYNLELWMLDYLSSGEDNRTLRQNTLRSHVQVKWAASSSVPHSVILSETLARLEEARADLWNVNIPGMIGQYFADLAAIFSELRRILPVGGKAVVAIGNSQYAGIIVDVAGILEQCVNELGFSLVEQGVMRSMRNSSQHGGGMHLAEHCLVFERREKE